MKIVHVQTSLQSIFGELDDEGNVVNKRPLSLELPKLSADVFAAAYEQLAKAKSELASPVAAPALQDK